MKRIVVLVCRVRNCFYHLFLSFFRLGLQSLCKLNVSQHLPRAFRKEGYLKTKKNIIERKLIQTCNLKKQSYHEHLFLLLHDLFVVDGWRSLAAEVVRDSGEELRGEFFQTCTSASLVHCCLDLLQHFKALCNLCLTEFAQGHLLDVYTKHTNTENHKSNQTGFRKGVSHSVFYVKVLLLHLLPKLHATTMIFYHSP